MRKRFFGVLIVLFLALTVPAIAFDQSRVLDILQQQGLSEDQVGMIIEDSTGKVFTLNETKKLKPASLMKILTAGASLNVLGPDFKFDTQLLSKGTVKNHVLKGSLYVKANGDPSFNSNDLYFFLGDLQKEGIKAIQGNIVIDDSKYSDIHTLSMRPWMQASNPGNYPLFINVDPPANIAPYSRSWLRAKKRLRRLLDLNDDYVIYQNMVEPDLWTGLDFLQLLKRSRISVTGKVIRGKIPDDARVIGSVTTPLTTVIHDMLKSSNNYYADMMIRNLAAQSGERPANVKAGMKFIYAFLDQAGVSHDDYSLNSGAGFTHRSYITAGALCAVLNHLRSQPEISPIFFASLPVAGTDGTLKYRMRKTEAQGKIHAKTGYLGRAISRYKLRDGVVALAGFATPTDGKTFTFVFLYNGTRSPQIVRNIFDKICVELVKDPGL
jgi:D-alanyl-D-alanine carboxypeptidase/D-alanyl-D-alanine-endopeptidase (penicillin-binding protein 4)